MVVVTEMDTHGIVYKNDNEQGRNAFTCFRCGVCCTIYQVYLDLPEAESIAAHLHLPVKEFLDKYADPRWPFKDTYILKQTLNGCVFLDQEEGSVFGLCRIHGFKPTDCRKWTANPDRKECRLGLKHYWNLTVDDEGKLTGTPEALQCFNTFLETLK
jgi:Fe-S-cluster containining protein